MGLPGAFVAELPELMLHVDAEGRACVLSWVKDAHIQKQCLNLTFDSVGRDDIPKLINQLINHSISQWINQSVELYTVHISSGTDKVGI